MHLFKCKVRNGELLPVSDFQKKLLSKLLKKVEDNNSTITLTIELNKKINDNQVQLYNAFILQASNYFDTTFEEIEKLLERFKPKDLHLKNKDVSIWTNEELNVFIEKSLSQLSEFGFKF